MSKRTPISNNQGHVCRCVKFILTHKWFNTLLLFLMLIFYFVCLWLFECFVNTEIQIRMLSHEWEELKDGIFHFLTLLQQHLGCYKIISSQSTLSTTTTLNLQCLWTTTAYLLTTTSSYLNLVQKEEKLVHNNHFYPFCVLKF